MNSIPIELPPEEEHRRILNKVAELHAMCDDLNKLVGAKRVCGDELIASEILNVLHRNGGTNESVSR